MGKGESIKQYKFKKGNPNKPREAGKIGGVRSGEARREKKKIKELLKTLLEIKLEDKKTEKKLINKFGTKAGSEIGANLNSEIKICLKLIDMAEKGNIKATTEVFDRVYGKAIQAVELENTADENITISYKKNGDEIHTKNIEIK